MRNGGENAYLAQLIAVFQESVIFNQVVDVSWSFEYIIEVLLKPVCVTEHFYYMRCSKERWCNCGNL